MARGVRGLLARLLALVAAVLLPLALVSVWLSAVVDDTERYVATVEPLAEDPAVIGALQRTLTQRTVAALEERGGALGGQVAARFEDDLDRAVRRVLESDLFPPVWSTANATAHDELLAQLRQEGGAADDVTLDLGRVADAVLDEVGDALPFSLGPVGLEAPVTVLEGEQVQQARTAYRALTAAGLWLPVLWLGAVALALLLARRRGRLLGLLGAASAVTTALALWGLELARDRAVGGVPGSDRALSAAVWDGLSADVRTALWVALGVAVLLALVGVLALRRPRT